VKLQAEGTHKVTKKSGTAFKTHPNRLRWMILAGVSVLVLAGLTAWWVNHSAADSLSELPEAPRVYAVQEKMPFQILVPAYLPGQFDRAQVDIQVNQSGPGGEPMTQLAYHTHDGATLFVREWVPIDPKKEILASSRPIQTKWGKGYLLRQGIALRAIWVDVGATRISLYTSNLEVVPEEQLLAIAETLGPPSNLQVFHFDAQPAIKDMPPPPPYEVQTNTQGIQEFTLVITPGGYDPIRFAVKKDIPVRLHFRMLGQVGCGNEMNFPADPKNPSSLILTSETDEKILDFTPRQGGDFQFYCAHQMYRGIMTVQP
jgi:hypothetical protein